MCVTTSTIAVGRNATTSSTPFHGPPFARRKSPSPISCAIPIASTATSTATGGAASHASTAVSPVPITAWSSQPPHGDGVVLFSFIVTVGWLAPQRNTRSEEHTSELQSRLHLVCRLLLEKKKKKTNDTCGWKTQT